MTICKTSAIMAALLAVGVQAHALTFSASSPLPLTYVAPTFTTADSSTAYLATDSVSNVRLAPVGATSYLAVSTGGSASVDLGGVSTFSFLWGSPDLFNSLSFTTSTGVETFTGGDLAALTGAPSNGSNANSTFLTVAGTSGQTISGVTFASGGISFEVAVTPVPEPTSYALMLAGLGAIGFVAARRRRG